MPSLRSPAYACGARDVASTTQTHFESDLSHAFCVSLYQSQKVARLIHALVEAQLAAAGAKGAAAGASEGSGSAVGAAESRGEAAGARARL
jgi:hypothetical protein